MTITASAPVPAGNRLVDAPTLGMAAIRRHDDRYAEGYVDGLQRALSARGVATVEPSVSADDAQLIMRARLADPVRFRQLAEAIALGGVDGKSAVEALARQWGVFPQGGAW